MGHLHSTRDLPTHAELITFLQTFLPSQALTTTTVDRKDGATHTITKSDVPFLYHTPRHQSYSPTSQLVSKAIFSITPTPGVYSAYSSRSLQSHSQILRDTNANASVVCFLHRPWSLDRRAIPRWAVVLASHVNFDTYLTVGWNVGLAARLGIDVDNARCIQGYKGDSERKIGLVGKLRAPAMLSAITDLVRREFAGAGELHQHLPEAQTETSSVSSTMIETIAIMNAFHAEEVGRVISTATALLQASSDPVGRRVLYLTGAARELGLEAAKAVNMPAFCVGHRACEEWGIRYLTKMTREKWPALDIVEVMEEEVKPMMQEKKTLEPEAFLKADSR